MAAFLPPHIMNTDVKKYTKRLQAAFRCPA
jgi:hypothetical protein